MLEEDIARLEDGLETTVGPKGVKLSGGQMQRTAAARMFVRTPELLVFDDLSSALDVETEHVLWERVFARDKRHLPGRLPPQSRPAPRRPDHRHARRPHPRGRHISGIAGGLRRDATVMARGGGKRGESRNAGRQPIN